MRDKEKERSIMLAMVDIKNAATSNEHPASKLPLTILDEDGEELFECDSCGLHYRPSKSTSSLRLTYCGFLCEIGDLGFSIDGLEQMEIISTTDANADTSSDEGGSVDVNEEPNPVPSASTST